MRPPAAVAVLAALLLGLGAPAAGAASWSRPFALGGSGDADLGTPRIAFAADGTAATVFDAQQEDEPAISQPFVLLRSPGGRVSRPRRVPGAKQVLDLSFLGSSLDLLIGSATGGRACCDTVGTESLTRGSFGRPRSLVSGLTGAAVGTLSPMPSGGLLAAVAAGRGVWASASSARGRFGPARRLSPASQRPWTTAVAAPANGPATVAWLATPDRPDASGPAGIVAASGTHGRTPRRPRLVLRVPRPREIDELALAPRSARVTAAFIEGWFDRTGSYHAQAVLADLGTRSARPLATGGQLASDVRITGDRRGDQVVVWKTCDTTPACSVWAAVRPVGRHLSRAARLGSADPDQDPAVAISSGGQALVAWIASGQVLAAASTSGGRFTVPRVVSAAGDDATPALAFSPSGQALAVWVQGVVAPQLLGAVYR